MRHLNEFFDNSLFKMPEPIQITDKEKSELQNLKWESIKIKDPSETSTSTSDIFTMNFDLGKLNHILSGIVFKIESDNRTSLYQAHIQLYKDLQGIGLATKLYRSVLEEFGHLVSKKSKRVSDKEISGLYQKLAKDNKIDFFDRNGNFLLLHKGNPEYKNILDTFKAIY